MTALGTRTAVRLALSLNMALLSTVMKKSLMKISTWLLGLMETLACRVSTLLLGLMGIFGHFHQCFWDNSYLRCMPRRFGKPLLLKKILVNGNTFLTINTVVVKFIHLVMLSMMLLALYIKKFMILVKTLNIVKKDSKKLMFSVKIPASGGKMSLSMHVKKSPDVFCSKLLLGSFWIKLSLTFGQNMYKSQHQAADQLIQEEHGAAAVHKLLLVHGVYQWIFYPLSSVTAASRISRDLQQLVSNAIRIFLSY